MQLATGSNGGKQFECSELFVFVALNVGRRAIAISQLSMSAPHCRRGRCIVQGSTFHLLARISYTSGIPYALGITCLVNFRLGSMFISVKYQGCAGASCVQHSFSVRLFHMSMLRRHEDDFCDTSNVPLLGSKFVV